jgi:hypothetical protein
MENGTSAEMGVVGCDGVVGIAVFMGGDTTPNRAVVQSAGDAFRLELRFFREEFRRVGELHRALLLYTQALLTQMSQTAVCNRLHSVEQQLCRWLLLSHDRLQSDELVMTQELIANMLGVRREGVSVAAHRLQEAGLIRYRRGHITIYWLTNTSQSGGSYIQVGLNVRQRADDAIARMLPFMSKRS